MSFRLWRRKKPAGAEVGVRLHIGCGDHRLEGWVNIDSRALPGVDRVLDMRKGIPYRAAERIFAEHFLEHLALGDALAFLKECRRALAPDGILRLSTPNLEWVVSTHYHPELHGDALEAERECLLLNRAFRGWGHQFLYNRPMLAGALRAAGFRDVVFCGYGESEHPELRGLEGHKRATETRELPHVLIAEASGTAPSAGLPTQALGEFVGATSDR